MVCTTNSDLVLIFKKRRVQLSVCPLAVIVVYDCIKGHGCCCSVAYYYWMHPSIHDGFLRCASLIQLYAGMHAHMPICCHSHYSVFLPVAVANAAAADDAKVAAAAWSSASVTTPCGSGAVCRRLTRLQALTSRRTT